MHTLLAGLMGVFMSIGSFFHGGAVAHSTQTDAQANISGALQASPSGHGKFMMDLPAGEHPFFGNVSNVTGNVVTLTRGMRRDDTAASADTTSNAHTLTINLDSSTKYTNGSQADIKTGIRIAGAGKTNSDGSITAVSIVINPVMPSGMPRPNGRRGMGYGG